MSIWSGGQRVTLDKPPNLTDCYLYFQGERILRIPEASVFGVSFHSPDLDYWIDCEHPKDHWTQVVHEPYPKFFKKVHYRQKIARYPGTYFLDLWCHRNGIEGCFDLNPCNPHFFWVGTTLGVLLNLVVYMGYQRIHIADGDYSGYHNYPARLYLCEFAEVARRHGVQLISCIHASPINSAMEYKSLEQAVADSRTALTKRP